MDQAPDERDAARALDRARDTRLVLAIRAGDANAFGQLYDHWFDRVFDLASRIVRNPDIAAEVAQDTFLKAWRSLDSLDNPDSFGGWLLRIARNAAYNRSEKEGRSSAVDDQGLAVIESVGASPVGAPAGFGVEDRLGRAATPDAALEDREAVSLVWEAARALPERDLEVLDLQLRHGLTPAEIGEVMGMNRNSANQLVHRLKGRLETAIRARVLWRGGEPACAILAARLADADITSFNAEAVRVVERHIPGCLDCDERQKLRLQPAALFAAAPLLAAPILIKAQAAAALGAAGVPMGGSAFGSAVVSGLAPAGPGSGAGGSGAGGSGGPGGAGAHAGQAVGPAQPVTGSAFGGAVQPVTGAALGGAVVSSTARRSRLVRNSLIGAVAAAAVVVVAIIGFSLRSQSSPSTAELSATGTAPRTSTTTAPGTTTSAKPDPSTTVVVTPSGPASTTPTTPGGPPPTVAPTTPTTQPSTTTTTITTDVTFTIDPATIATPYPMTPSRGFTPPTLTWKVTSNAKVTVAVEGPEGTTPKKLLSSDPQGTYVVCPGVIASVNKANTCTANPGTSTYTLTVYGPTGKALTTKSVTLTLTPPPPPIIS